MAYYRLNLRDLKYVDNYFDNCRIVEKANSVSTIFNAAELINNVRDKLTGDAIGALFIDNSGYIAVLIESDKVVTPDAHIWKINFTNPMEVTPSDEK